MPTTELPEPDAMRRSLAAFALAITAALATLVTQPALAAPEPVKGWAMPQATKDEATGKMQYCAVEALYDNTTVLVLARAVNDANSIGIGTPTKETFGGGNMLKATVQVDNEEIRRLGASALTPYLVSIGTGKDDALWSELKRGNVLKITFPEAEQGFEFKLKGSSKAMGNVELCLAGKPIPKPTPRQSARAARPAPQQAALPPNMDPKIEQVLQSISGLLQAAGVQKATFRLPTTTSETSVAELFWVIPNPLSADPGQAVLGGLYDENSSKSFEALTKAYVTRMKDKCPGSFSDDRGDIQTRGTSTWQTADMACTGENGANSVALLFFKKGKDFSVFFHEEPATGNGAVFDLRDRLTAVVTQTLATE